MHVTYKERWKKMVIGKGYGLCNLCRNFSIYTTHNIIIVSVKSVTYIVVRGRKKKRRKRREKEKKEE